MMHVELSYLWCSGKKCSIIRIGHMFYRRCRSLKEYRMKKKRSKAYKIIYLLLQTFLQVLGAVLPDNFPDISLAPNSKLTLFVRDSISSYWLNQTCKVDSQTTINWSPKTKHIIPFTSNPCCSIFITFRMPSKCCYFLIGTC